MLVISEMYAGVCVMW